MPSSAAVDFKFRPDAPPDARRRVEDALSRLGASAHPLFPGESDPELSLMFVADCPPGRAPEVAEALGREPAVEYAEARPARKLIR